VDSESNSVEGFSQPEREIDVGGYVTEWDRTSTRIPDRLVCIMLSSLSDKFSVRVRSLSIYFEQVVLWTKVYTEV